MRMEKKRETEKEKTANKGGRAQREEKELKKKEGEDRKK